MWWLDTEASSWISKLLSGEVNTIIINNVDNQIIDVLLILSLSIVLLLHTASLSQGP